MLPQGPTLRHALLLFWMLCLVLGCQAQHRLAGEVWLDPGAVDAPPPAADIRVDVALFCLDMEAEPAGLTKRRLLGADSPQPLRAPPADVVTTAVRGRATSERGLAAWTFEFTDLRAGDYAVVAYEPAPGPVRWLDFAPPRRQWLGVYKDPDGCATATAFSGAVCGKAVAVGAPQSAVRNISILLQAPVPLPVARAVPNGVLRRSNKTAVTIVRLRGTAYERGFAMGQLLAPQIVDMFDFLLIEDMVRSKALYTERFVPALRRIARLTPQFRDGLRGVLNGMRAPGRARATCLGREMALLDLVALNTYADAAAWTGTGNGAGVRAAACSQFAFWGTATPTGRTVAGRNMDGENDIRKLTVNALVLYALEPAEDDQQRVVHVMWPGFLGMSSGFNAAGKYLMEDAGCSPPGAPAPRSPVLRDVIASLLLNKSLPATLPPSQFVNAVAEFRSEAGGACVNGCILVSVGPYAIRGAGGEGQGVQAPEVPGPDDGAGGPGVGDSVVWPAYVYEGDRYGGAVRVPGQVPPVTPTGIMATNHYLGYRVVPGHSERCNGGNASFSSLARYFAGQNAVEAQLRNRAAGWADTAAVKAMLQLVSHGTTEHSVIFHPETRDFEVAVASPNGVWDAPYRPFVSFSFEEVFEVI